MKTGQEAGEPDTKCANRATGERSGVESTFPEGPLPSGQTSSRHAQEPRWPLTQEVEEERSICLFIQEMVTYLQIIIIERHFCSLISTQK